MVVVCWNKETLPDGLERKCPRYGDPTQPMRFHRELPDSWVMHCPYCGLYRAVTKSKVGGTMGAGDQKAGLRQYKHGWSRNEDYVR